MNQVTAFPERLSCRKFIQELEKASEWKMYYSDGEYILMIRDDEKVTNYLSPNSADFTRLEWLSFEGEISNAIKIKMGAIDGPAANGDEAQHAEPRGGDGEVEQP